MITMINPRNKSIESIRPCDAEAPPAPDSPPTALSADRFTFAGCCAPLAVFVYRNAEFSNMLHRRFVNSTTFFTWTGLVRWLLGVTRAKGPAHTSLRQCPRPRAPTNNPKRQRRGPISDIMERSMLDPHRASKPFSGVSRKKPAVASKAWNRIP